MHPPRRTEDDVPSIPAPIDECHDDRRPDAIVEEVGRLRASGYERREVSRLLGIDEETVMVAEAVRRRSRPSC